MPYCARAVIAAREQLASGRSQKAFVEVQLRYLRHRCCLCVKTCKWSSASFPLCRRRWGEGRWLAMRGRWNSHCQGLIRCPASGVHTHRDTLGAAYDNALLCSILMTLAFCMMVHLCMDGCMLGCVCALTCCALCQVLPQDIREPLVQHENRASLLEVYSSHNLKLRITLPLI